MERKIYFVNKISNKTNTNIEINRFCINEENSEIIFLKYASLVGTNHQLCCIFDGIFGTVGLKAVSLFFARVVH